MHLANYDYEREDVFPVPFFTWSCPFHEQWEKELIEIFYSYRDNVENNPTEVTPSVSVSAGSKDIYIKARLTQTKDVGSPVSGDDVIYLECISETYNQVDLDINWQVRPEE